MNRTVSVKVLVMIDGETLKGMPGGLSRSERAKRVASSLRTAEDIEALNLSAWKERINVDIPATTATAATRAARVLPFVGNLIAGFAQIVAVASISRELDQAKGMAAVEARSRLAGNGALLFATFADTADRVLKVLSKSRQAVGKDAMRLEFWAGQAARTAKALGIIGAGIGVLCDLYEIRQAYLQGNNALVAAYVLSVFAGGGIIVAIVLASVWLAIVAAVLYLFAQIGIGILGNNSAGNDKLSAWLRRSVWGNDRANRYANQEMEMKALGAMTGA